MIGSGKFAWTAAAAGLALVVAGCGGSSSAATPAVGPSPVPVRPTPSPARPTVVEVTCDAGTTITTTKEAVVDRDGLHLKVTNSSGLKGTYLNYASGPDGAGGGDEVPAGTTERVLMVPPGEVYLDCSYKGAQDTAKVKVRAGDPNGYYRSVTLGELGCTPRVPVDWGPGPGRGKTAEAALDALVVVSKEPGLHARTAPVGYVQSGFTSYLLEREGSPWASAVVSPRGGEYVASLVDFCL